MGSTETPSGFESFVANEKQAFCELMDNTDPSTEVWIEKYDDVSVKKGANIECIQLKSATSKSHNPLSDKSVDLWKSLSNWVDKMAELENDPSIAIVKCRYSVSTPHSFNVGCIATLFNSALKDEDSKNALRQAKDIIGAPSKSLEPYTNNFFLPRNELYAIATIRFFTYEIHRDFYREIRKKFHETSFVASEMEDSLFETMCGWIRSQSSSFSEKGEAALLLREGYRDKLTTEAARLRENPLTQPAPEPSREEVRFERTKRDKYLVQLQLIDSALNGSRDEIATKAIIEKLKSECLVAKLAENAAISSISLEAYRDDLVAEWNDQRDINLLNQAKRSLTDEQTGAAIFIGTRIEAKTTRLQGFDTPAYFSRGQLHDLANEAKEPLGAPRIGWHPRYSDILNLASDDNEG